MNNKYFTHKWVNAILLIAVLQYLHLLYTDISTMDKVLRCVDCPFRLVSLFSYFDLLTIPVILFLFFRHLRWGWILLFGSKLFTIIPSLIYYFHDYLPLPYTNLFPSFLLGILMNVVVLVLLWKPEVTEVFNLNKRIKLITVLVTALLLLLVSLPRIMS